MNLKNTSLALATLLAVACGDDDVVLTDSGPMDAGVDAMTQPDASADGGGLDGGPDGGGPDASDPDAGPADECAVEEARTCVDETNRETCIEGPEGNLVLSSEACDADVTCVYGACPTTVQTESIAQLRTYMSQVQMWSGNPHPIDWAMLDELTVREFLAHEDAEEALIRAVTRFVRNFGHGHQSVQFGEDGFSSCGIPDGYAYTAQTFYEGVCGLPHGDEILVTGAPDGNALGLSPGEVIVSTSTWPAGENFLDEVAQAPGCLTRVGATESSDRHEAAASFFGKIDEGMTLEVRGLDGAMRTVNVTARETDITSGQDYCISPFGGYDTERGELTIREDGVAVIRMSTLHTGPFSTAEEYYELVDAFHAELGALLETVPDGAPIIWDIRGNRGGSQEVALGIVAGMPGAVGGPVNNAYWRVYETDPAEWETESYAGFSFEIPVSDEHVTNHRDHAVAVLIDGQSVSAADWFAWGAKNRADALIVGPAGSAGIYGYGGGGYDPVEGPVTTLAHQVDPFRMELLDGTLLEGHSVEPDMVVAYDPTDMMNGVDTVLEAAAAALLD